MADDDKVPAVHSWNELLQNGVPQILLGPAGKAISRLVAGATEIPLAYLDRFTQRIHSRTEAEAQVMSAIAAKSAEMAAADPELIARSLDSFLRREARQQLNREAVAKEAVDRLSEDPAPVVGDGPSDDWMNIFEDHAAKASSETLRDLFGRILAGEIRKPGKFSPATLHLVSIIDRQTAEWIQAVAAHVWSGLILQGAVNGRVPHAVLTKLDGLGFLTVGTLTHATLTSDANGHVQLLNGGAAVIGLFEPVTDLRVPVHLLTSAGEQLLDIVSAAPDVKAAVQALWSIKPEPKLVKSGIVTYRNGDRFQALYNRDWTKTDAFPQLKEGLE